MSGVQPLCFARTFAAPMLFLMPAAAWAQASPSPFTTATRYDNANRITGTIAPDPDDTGPLHYAAVRNTYDDDGRLTRVEKGELASWQSEAIDPSAWTGFTVFSEVDTTYDGMDRKLTDTVSSVAADHSLTPYSLTQYSYDPVGRPDCTATRMNPAVYASLPTSACTLGAEGGYGPDRITRNTYDDAGQLLKVTKAYGTPLQQDYVTYTYTSNGKPETVKDANGNKARYSYDGFDRQIQWNFPDKVTAGTVSATDYEAYAYDASGNRTSLRKRDGRTFTYNYDALNRMTSKIVPDSCVAGYACTSVNSYATRDVYYSYDLRNLQTAARFDSTSGTDAVLSTYDGFGELASSTTAMGGVSRTLAYQYDADGNRSQVNYPSGFYVTQSWDGLDRPSVTSENGSLGIVEEYYDAQGRRFSEWRGSVQSYFGYDSISRLNLLANDLSGTAADITTTLTYNPANQIVTKGRSNDGYAFTGYVNVSRSYAANGLNQYTAAVSATTVSATFGYDSNGNLVSDGTTNYAYDAENRMVATSTGLNLVYDANGRLWQTSGGSWPATQFLYDGDALVAEYDGSGTLTHFYVHGSEEDDPKFVYQDGHRYALQADTQGSIVSIANSDTGGVLLGINTYDEYGIPGAGNIGRFQYTGQAWLPELGMYYYKARIYSPTLGRFMQTDPIGYKDQNNLYAYVGNDPINSRDPSGLYDCAGTQGECRAMAALVKGLDVASKSNRISSEQRDVLRSAAKTLGTAGDKNGITVKFENLGKTDQGQLIMGKADADSNTIAMNVNGISQYASSSNWRNAFIEGISTVGHEVRHLQDGPVGSNDLEKRLRTETHGYETDSIIRQAFGMSGLNDRQIQSGAVNSCIEATGHISACQQTSQRLYPGAYR